jgi:hypothetical protein
MTHPQHPQQLTVKEAIEQGNSLIAEFMGWVKDTKGKWCKPAYGDGWNPTEEGYSSGSRYFTEELLFHRSWDWIMEALKTARKKIDNAGWGTPQEKDAWRRLNAALNEVYNINIDSAQFCLVKFIQWYNDQKTPQ